MKAQPDNVEDYSVNKDGPRVPAAAVTNNTSDYYANPKDSLQGGILSNGTLPVADDQGVHSLTDVPVFARGKFLPMLSSLSSFAHSTIGPCQAKFGGVYSATDIFFNMVSKRPSV